MTEHDGSGEIVPAPSGLPHVTASGYARPTVFARLRCRWRGHKLPRQVDETHPAITLTWSDGVQASGRAAPIPCERCGHLVGPFDDGYPMIIPRGSHT